jgi:hypothetical protein
MTNRIFRCSAATSICTPLYGEVNVSSPLELRPSVPPGLAIDTVSVPVVKL